MTCLCLCQNRDLYMSIRLPAQVLSVFGPLAEQSSELLWDKHLQKTNRTIGKSLVGFSSGRRLTVTRPLWLPKLITSQFRFVAESNFWAELENGSLDQPKEINLNMTVYNWAVYNEGTKIKRKQEEGGNRRQKKGLQPTRRIDLTILPPLQLITL